MRIGTFNLNNLFGRFNFHGAVDEIEQGHDTVTVTYTFTDPDDYRLERNSHGLLVAKPADERDTLAGRIGTADLDVLAVQEVEDLDTLRRFNRDHLKGSFGHLALLEGNDPRFIDVAVLSRHPLGATTSWQHAVHPDAPDRRVFGRDLLEVDILTPTRNRRLLRLYVGHAKSHYVDWRLRGDARDQAIEQANLRRRQQAEMTAEIVQARTRPDSPYVVLGDFNDPPDSPWLAPLTDHPELQLVDGLAEPDETRPAKEDTSGPGPSSPAWTYRHKEPGQPATYLLYDQIWLSPSLAARQTGATIDRRTLHGGDGSDHDLAWVDLDLP